MIGSMLEIPNSFTFVGRNIIHLNPYRRQLSGPDRPNYVYGRFDNLLYCNIISQPTSSSLPCIHQDPVLMARTVVMILASSSEYLWQS